MENEKIIENKIEEFKKIRENAIQNNDEGIVGFCDKSIEDLEKKLAEYRQVAEFTAVGEAVNDNEVESYGLATVEQKAQSRGKLNKIKVALAGILAAAGITGIGIIAFLAGKKFEKDKNADETVKALNDNEAKIEQEVKENIEKTETEKVVEEAIALEETKDEVVAEPTQEEKKETKTPKTTKSTKEEVKEETKQNVETTNTIPQTSAPVSQETFDKVVSDLAKEGINPTTVETYVEVNENQTVISENSNTTGGQLISSTDEVIENKEVNSDNNVTTVEEKKEVKEETKPAKEETKVEEKKDTKKEEVKTETKTEVKEETKVEEQVKEETNETVTGQEAIETKEEVVEDNVVLPDLDPEVLALIESLNAQQIDNTEEIQGKTR